MGNIVWLASYPKSGNTWLRAFIHNLVEDPDQPMPLDSLSSYFESESKPRWYEPYLQQPLAETSFDEVIALRPQVHKNIAGSVTRGSVMTKTHNQFTHYNGVPLHNMEVTAAAIYIVRNPLDVVISAADHFGLSLDQAIEFMRNPQTASANDEEGVGGFFGSWSEHVESWTKESNPNFLILRFEDMLDKPNPSFGKIAKLLGLANDRKRIQKAIKFSSFGELKKQELKSGFTERSTTSKAFFRKGKKHQWIEQLSESQAAQIVDHHREQMQRFGYIPPKFR